MNKGELLWTETEKHMADRYIHAMDRQIFWTNK